MKTWLATLLFACATLAQAEVWHVGLIGDVPYADDERRELPYLLESMARQGVDFIAHIGDFKHGKDRCDDALFADRYQLFNASRVPFVFTPGDNEWMDCGRLSNGGYDPLERLDKLRRLFWVDNFSLGQKKLPLERQPGAYREHARFVSARCSSSPLTCPAAITISVRPISPSRNLSPATRPYSPG